jgi:hypothetical protein
LQSLQSYTAKARKPLFAAILIKKALQSLCKPLQTFATLCNPLSLLKSNVEK